MNRRELLRFLPVAMIASVVAVVSGVHSALSDEIPWIEVPLSMSETELDHFERGLAKLYRHYVIVKTDCDGVRRVNGGGREKRVTNSGGNADATLT